MNFAILWFFILGALLVGYAILDGFDLGVGVVYPFIKGDRERRLALNSIGPLWDGNEVWLVTFAGGLFAAFPEAYATLLSSLYLPMTLLLVSLIGRAISIEFRSKRPSRLWRGYWDFSFALSSAAALFAAGFMAGSALYGIPLDAAHERTGGAAELLAPYPIAVGLLAVATAAMHGTIFLYLKTEGELQERVRPWMWKSFFLFAALYLGVTAMTIFLAPHALRNFERWPAAWVVVLLNLLAVLNIPRAIHLGRPGYAFVSSSATIAALIFLFGMALFPNLVIAHPELTDSLTIERAAASESTLKTMSWIALIGAPLVATYTAIIYWVFRGKVKLTKDSY